MGVIKHKNMEWIYFGQEGEDKKKFLHWFFPNLVQLYLNTYKNMAI